MLRFISSSKASFKSSAADQAFARKWHQPELLSLQVGKCLCLQDQPPLTSYLRGSLWTGGGLSQSLMFFRKKTDRQKVTAEALKVNSRPTDYETWTKLLQILRVVEQESDIEFDFQEHLLGGVFSCCPSCTNDGRLIVSSGFDQCNGSAID